MNRFKILVVAITIVCFAGAGAWEYFNHESTIEISKKYSGVLFKDDEKQAMNKNISVEGWFTYNTSGCYSGHFVGEIRIDNSVLSFSEVDPLRCQIAQYYNTKFYIAPIALTQDNNNFNLQLAKAFNTETNVTLYIGNMFEFLFFETTPTKVYPHSTAIAAPCSTYEQVIKMRKQFPAITFGLENRITAFIQRKILGNDKYFKTE